MVVAERVEQARFAASLIEIEYERGPFAVEMEDALQTTYKPEQVNGDKLTFSRGDVDAALAKADIKLDVTYRTPNEHPCALEPHATIASFSGGSLTVYNSTQWVDGDRNVLAPALGLPVEKVRVICPSRAACSDRKRPSVVTSFSPLWLRKSSAGPSKSSLLATRS